MNKSRKILTSVFLASAMGLLLTMGAVAEEPDISESLNENDTDISVSVTKTNASAEAPSEPAEPQYSTETTYFGNKEDVKTSGGAGGWVTIRSGIFKRCVNPVGSVRLWYNGVSAEIVGGSGDYMDLKTNITIDAQFRDASHTYDFSESDNTNKLEIVVDADNYINCHAVISTSSNHFGYSNQEINRNLT